MSTDESIWQLFVLCLLALGDTVPKSYFLTIVWETPAKEKVAKWSPVPASILEGFGFLRFPAPSKTWSLQEKERICENLQLSPKIFPRLF